MKTKTDQSLKAKFEAAIAKSVAAVGVNGLSKRDLIKRFSNKGTSEATLYRWFEASIASGKPGQKAVRSVKAAAAARGRRGADPASSVAKAVTETLPAVVRLDDVSGTPTIRIIERLNQAIDAMDQLMAHARTEDGKVRNAKLLLGAADKLRACLDTAVKIQQAMRSVDEVDRLHQAMIAEIAKCDRDLAERVIRAMRAVSSSWSG
jgi:hypothetical protein